MKRITAKQWPKCHSAVTHTGCLAQFWALSATIPTGNSQCSLETSACQFTLPGSLCLEGECGRKEELSCVAVNSAMHFGHGTEMVPIYFAE